MPTPNERLRRERQLRGWSQGHLAEQIGVPDYYISRWERGEVLPSPYYQQKLCDVFGKTAEDLGMLQTKADMSLTSMQETNKQPLVPPSNPFPLADQSMLPPTQIPPALHLPDTSTAKHVSTPSLLTRTIKLPQPRRRRNLLVMLALLLIVLISAGLGSFLLLSRTNPVSASPIVGHLYFLSSGQTSEMSNQGIADEVRLNVESLHAPAAGNSYYAWLVPDEDKPENPAIALGKVTINRGSGQLFYSNSKHTNLLAITSGLLITEQDATITPLFPSTDRSDWRYVAEIPQTVPPKEAYSLLDHLRHLLANDPKLNANHMPGGLAIWLYRNTQAVYGWSNSARDDWQAGKTANSSAMRQDVIRMLDYLDGIPYVEKDLPSTISTPVLVDSRIGRIGLLEFDPQQALPGYLNHIDLHLNGLASSPGATASLQAQVAQIISAISTVNSWLEHVRQDAKLLVAMSDEHLQQQQALTLLNDMVTNTNFVLVGKSDPVTGETQEGVEWIYQAIQNLTIMNIMSYKG